MFLLASTGHIHPDKPDACICQQFLIGKCSKGPGCENHHCLLPYRWQYKGSIFDEWKNFSDTDNLALEKLYCDVNVATEVNFKPNQSLDVSRLERQVYILFNKQSLINYSNFCSVLIGTHKLSRFSKQPPSVPQLQV